MILNFNPTPNWRSLDIKQIVQVAAVKTDMQILENKKLYKRLRKVML